MRLRTLLTIVFTFAGLATLGWGVSSALGALQAQEALLSLNGEAYEINTDTQGFLWISDYGAGEIRRVNPASGSITVYPVGDNPSDARSDGVGSLWWADFMTHQVGRLSIVDGGVTLWEIPGADTLFGTGLGSSGDIWVTDSTDPFLGGTPHLYHLSPSASEVCTYTLPSNGSSDYLLVDGGSIWLGDWVNGQIDRLETASSTFTQWPLPLNNRPASMALDGQGNLWWADPILKQLAQLQPASNQVILYTQALADHPMMITLEGGRVWFTDQSTIGVLDPTRAAGQALSVTPQSQVIPPACGALAAPTTKTITPTTGQATWTAASYPTLSSQGGWYIFQLPQTSFSWGIAFLDDIWFVDQGRQVLAKVSTTIVNQAFLPLALK